MTDAPAFIFNFVLQNGIVANGVNIYGPIKHGWATNSLTNFDTFDSL